jgi:predicted nucleotidyltransferase
LRGAHVLPLRELVGIAPPRETLEISETRDAMEWDIVSHDIGKFCRLLVKSSGYALEQLTSPLVVATSPAHEELREIALAHLNRRFARHYFGFAGSQWKLFQKESPPRAKRCLRVSVLLSGIHLMQSGRIEPICGFERRFQNSFRRRIDRTEMRDERKTNY